MKIALLASILLFFPLILISCKKDNPIPPEEQPRINITLEDVSCTEAWIKLSTSNLTFPASVDLLKDSSFVEVINLTSADTILYVDSLLPNKTYSFNSIIQSSNQSIFSDPLQFTTMDTTPHNFTWQSWTFGGQAGSCTLYDVAIINENDIWAVGEIYLLDTLGQPDPLPYNAIHWDGNQWQIKRISVTHNGSSITPPLYGIFTFSAKDLWLSSGVPIHGDGVNWTQYHLFDMGILSQEDGYLTKIWGGTATDIYFVGTLGTIAHYQNGQWSRIESGTEIPLSDICTFNINDIVISGADNLNIQGILLRGNYTSGFHRLIESGLINESELFSKLYGSLSSVWIDEKNTLYTGGNLLYRYKFDKWDYVHSMPENFINGNPNVYYRGFIISIRGNKSNDYWVVGDRNTVRHFNGCSWVQVGTSYDPMSFIRWRAVRVKNNICVVAGDSLNTAKIMMIKK